MEKPIKAKTRWYIMRELAILSLNLIALKDLIQQGNRYESSLKLLRVQSGPMSIISLNVHSRMIFIKKRILNILKNVLIADNFKDKDEVRFKLTIDTISITKKNLDRGYCIISDVNNKEYLLDLRNGNIFENNSTVYNFLELRYRKLGGIYTYLKINVKNPFEKIFDIYF